MKNIVIVYPFNIKNMLTQRVHHLITFLSKKNFNLIVIYKDNSYNEEIHIDKNIKYILLGLEFSSMSKIIKYDKQYLGDILDKYLFTDIDVVYLSLPFCISFIDYFKDKCKLLIYDDTDYYSQHDLKDEILSRNVFACEKYCIENADIVFNISRGLTKQRIEDNFKNPHMYPIGDGAHTNLYNILIEKKKGTIIYAGVIEEKRGFKLAIEGIKLLKDRGYNIHLDIFGEGTYKESLRKLVKQFSLDEQIKINNKITHEELIYIMPQYEFGLLTLDETQAYVLSSPIKLFEYMASGLITIGTPIGEIEEIIKCYNVGVLVTDAYTFASSLENLLLNPSEAELVKNNAIQASKAYDWNVLFERMLMIIQEKLNSNYKNKNSISKIAPEHIFNITKDNDEIKEFYLERLRNIFARVNREGRTKLYLYGAGEHTAMLLRYMKQLGSNPIIGLIDKNKQLQGQEQFGYKVFSFEECIDTCDAIIISSYAYEQEIYNQIIPTCITNDIYVQGIYNDFA